MTILDKILNFFRPKNQEVKKLIDEGEVDLPKYDKKKHTPPKRARTKKGTYVADDKSTKDINEAWVGGKAPEKSKTVARVKAKGKKPQAKKTKVQVVRKKKK